MDKQSEPRHARRGAAPESEEGRLVASVARGDRRAFEALFRLYFPRLVRFVDPLLRHPASIEEVASETLLLVWQKAATYDGSARVSTWIFGIAYRRALKALSRMDLPVDVPADLEEASADDAPECRLDTARRRLAVGAAIAALPLEQRATVQLAYFHDMDYAEIADVLECPVNTVKTRMFHARRRLRTLLAGMEEDWT